MTAYLSTFTLVALLALAAIWDLRVRRIPNLLTGTGCLAALVFRAPAGLDAMAAGALGLVLAFAFGALVFAVGGMGGGDVKLLAMVGAFLGPLALGYALLATALVGSVMAIMAALRYGLLLDTLNRTLGLIRSGVGAGNKSRRTIATPGALTIPYGVAIAIGGLYGWFGHAIAL